jgi:ATP-dependent exoDNAse (exonuclease V) beta subunit
VTPLVDAAERERIRGSLDETLVVEAAAGTGKTSELVARLVNVLAEGRGDVQSIAALTFTEKAAGELKLRLRAGLEEARQRAGAGGAPRRRLEEAIAHLEEARVSTIHGFCNDLLHERPVEARVDPGFAVLAEPEAEALYRRAFDGWLAEQLEAPPEGLRRALRRRSFDGDPVDRLRRAGWQLAGWRDFRAPWARRPFDRAGAIETLVARVHVLYEELTTCATGADTLYADLWPLRRLSEDVRTRESVAPRDLDWLEAALADLLRERSFRSPRRGNPRNYRGVPRDAVLATHADLVAALEAFAREADADLVALVQESLLETVDRYEALKARAAALDFVDLLLRARDLVRDRREVRADLQRRLSHVFVDEFQDTDPLQAEIVLLLSAADPSIDRWGDVTPAPGKLFVVGDPKQSIYRFRRAEVGTYQAVKDLLIARGAGCIYLTTSFRATPSIQRLVNATFAPAMREDRAALQAGYVPLAPHRDERRGQPGIVALPVPRPYGRYGGFTKTAVDESLPDAVGAFVAWLVNESGFTVTERERPGEEVPVAARHVCLLFRRFTTWGRDVTRDYVEALEARGIPHLLVGGRSFHLREEVESLRTALTAVEWPDDELSVYATLKGPLFAVGDEELVEYRHRFRRLHPYRLPKEEGEVGPSLRPVVDALALLRSLHGLRNHRPLEETVQRLLAATRAHAAFVLRPWGEQALANVLRVAELARTHEAAGSISFRGFVERLREEAQGEAPEAPIVEESSDGVRIMTVHRAKGLEFPVVILADITAGIAGNPGRHVDPERGLCALRLGGWQPWDLLDHEDAEAARDRAEGVRVAYVAATRARDLLVVPAVGDDPFVTGWDAASDGWISPLHAGIYPSAERRRLSTDAPSCPGFGEDSVLERPDRDTPGRDNVRPGLHAFGQGDGGYEVTWWDPRRLALDVRRVYGLRREDLIQDPGRETVEADRRRYDEWLAGRQAAQERGARPSLSVRTVTEWASTAPEHDDDGTARAGDVEIVAAAPGTARPGGPRFGALVHAALATVQLDAVPSQVGEAVCAQARILGATGDEVEAATRLVGAALEHPLLARARDVWREGRCRRESPVAFTAPDGSLVEGVLDLAFEDDGGWTVVDFKTDAELAGALARYRRQVALYASMVARATARPARAILLQL